MNLKSTKVLFGFFRCGSSQTFIVFDRPTWVSILGLPFIVLDKRVKVNGIFAFSALDDRSDELFQKSINFA